MILKIGRIRTTVFLLVMIVAEPSLQLFDRQTFSKLNHLINPSIFL